MTSMGNKWTPYMTTGNKRVVEALMNRENENPPPPLMWLFLSVINDSFVLEHTVQIYPSVNS